MKKPDYLYSEVDKEIENERFDLFFRYYLDRCSTIRDKLQKGADPSDTSHTESSTSIIMFTPIETRILEEIHKFFCNGTLDDVFSVEDIPISKEDLKHINV